MKQIKGLITLATELSREMNVTSQESSKQIKGEEEEDGHQVPPVGHLPTHHTTHAHPLPLYPSVDCRCVHSPRLRVCV